MQITCYSIPVQGTQLSGICRHQTLIGGEFGATIPSGWYLVATADFDSDGNPDFLLYNPGTHEPAIWYLNNNVFVSSASGPTLPAAWGWIEP